MAAQEVAKRFLDIEEALRWAYRDELPKHERRRALPNVAGEHVWSPYTWPAGYPEASPSFREAAGSGPSGGTVDGWSRDPGLPGTPHPDALAIEAAVDGLKAWRGHGFGRDDAAGLMHGIDHMEIDHVQAGMEAVAAMPGIVTVHARGGTRPRWSRQLPEPFADTGGNGKPRVLIDEVFVETFDKWGRMYFEPTPNPQPGAIVYREPVPCSAMRKGTYRMGAYCPLLYKPAPARIVAERAEWAAWRIGLELVYQALTGRLASIAPLPPAAPWRPWAGEGEAHGRPPQLFKGQRDEPYRRETREQAALRRRAAQRRRLGVRTEETRQTRVSSRRRYGEGTNGA